MTTLRIRPVLVFVTTSDVYFHLLLVERKKITLDCHANQERQSGETVIKGEGPDTRAKSWQGL